MHPVEAYGLHAGLKISRPEIYEKYHPIGFDNFITFHVNKYRFVQDVVDILNPVLSEKGISIAELESGTCRGVQRIPNIADFHLLKNVLRRSALHFGEYSFTFDIAAETNTKSVILVSTAPPSVLAPFWPSKNQYIVENYKSDAGNPYYGGEETVELLNKITPEQVATKVFEALDIDHKIPYETFYTGSTYNINSVSINVFPMRGYVYTNYDDVIVRLDLNLDYEALNAQLHNWKSTIYTDRPFDINRLGDRINQIKEFVIEIKDDNPDLVRFALALQKAGIKVYLTSYVPEDKAGDIKLAYLDVDKITFIKESSLNLPPNKEIYFRSNAYIAFADKFYVSEKDIFSGKNVIPKQLTKLDGHSIQDAPESLILKYKV